MYGKGTLLGLCLFSGIAFLGLSLFKVEYILYIYNSIVGLLLVFFCFFLGISRDLWVSLGESLGISRAHQLWGSRDISYIYGDVRNHPERSWSFGGGRSPKEINIYSNYVCMHVPPSRV